VVELFGVIVATGCGLTVTTTALRGLSQPLTVWLT
jgi:hypothetical protein